MQIDVRLAIGGACCVGVVFMLVGIFVVENFQRFFRRFFIIGIINQIIGDTKEDVNQEARTSAPPVVHRTAADLRAKAQSLDFDEALAKYTGQKPTPDTPTQSPKLAHLDDDLDSSRPLRRVEHPDLEDTDED